MNNLVARVISALVLAAVVLWLTWFGGLAFRILVVAMGAAIAVEWAVLCGVAADRRLRSVYGVLAAAVLLLVLSDASTFLQFAAAGAAAIAALVAGQRSGRGGWAAAGLVYATAPAIAAAAIRGDSEGGLVAILFIFAVVWATDIFAYFIGRIVGGPKLAPAISPGKTWSGAVGGAFFALAAGLAMASAAGTRAGIGLVVAILVISAVSQAGDLFESSVKRRFGAKDSSHIIPGHGGVMDRVDGLVVALIAFYVIGLTVSWAGGPSAGIFAW